MTFIGIFPNRYSSEENIEKYKNKYGLPFELKRDYYQTITCKMNAQVTPEVVIYNEKEDEILYQGRIDDSYARVGQKRLFTRNHELRDALEAIKNDLPVVIKETEAVGCFITFY